MRMGTVAIKRGRSSRLVLSSEDETDKADGARLIPRRSYGMQGGRFLRTAELAVLLVFNFSFFVSRINAQSIDRYALVTRNNPVVTSPDTLSSLTVGNGRFAFTADFTGLQSFPEYYAGGIPLGTMSQWGWHSFPDTESYRHEETLREYDFGHGHTELYSVQIKDDERGKAACDYFRANPHRLHLGTIGLDFAAGESKTTGEELPDGADSPADASFSDIRSTLDLWSGTIDSRFVRRDTAYHIRTACHPERDIIAANIVSKAHTPLLFSFPYPTGRHTDDACEWHADGRHRSAILAQTDTTAMIVHSIDSTTYYLAVRWDGHARVIKRAEHRFALVYDEDSLSITCEFLSGDSEIGVPTPTAGDVFLASQTFWRAFWQDGAAVDFSACTDPRAGELERRVVLSQYLLAVQCAGDMPPQETGLTYNSWFGKFHLEMIWWHQAHFALWGRPQMLERSLAWYASALPAARRIAERQGFDGARWMKMTDPSAVEAPSSVGSFLIWQQPHLIYLSELLRRANEKTGTNGENPYSPAGIQHASPQQDASCDFQHPVFDLIDATARFMASFATRDSIGRRYVLRGIIPAQETLKAAETINPPLELSYWYYGLKTAQEWRERTGLAREPLWDDILDGLSPLSYSPDSLYLAAETAPYITNENEFSAADSQSPTSNIRLSTISDHPAVLGALGMLPCNPLIDEAVMRKTLLWICDNWNWEKTWGWDYPMTAMCAARVGERDIAVDALLNPARTNTYLTNGHNYQDGRLRCYLPGNGGLLTAVAMMCAGWDGCADSRNPGFPDDGTWDVHWEGLLPLP